MPRAISNLRIYGTQFKRNLGICFIRKTVMKFGKFSKSIKIVRKKLAIITIVK